MPKLSNQQRALVRNLAKGMTITAAALAAGYSENCPGQSGSQALEAIRLKMPEVLEKAGLTDESLIENYLKPALQATETKFAQFEGEFTDEREVLAWGPRLTALDLAFNLKGSYAPKPEALKATSIAVKVTVEHIGRDSKPELRVAIERPVLDVDGSTFYGRMAQLVKEGFFKSPRTYADATDEGIRRGWCSAKTPKMRSQEYLDKLAGMGFLTREAEGYQAVPGMKITIVEEKASRAIA